MKKHLEQPTNWQDFEDLCYILWKFIWQDRHTQKNGRQGQAQHGVDIYGVPHGSSYYEGVQCKGKNADLKSKLTIAEIKEELTKAKKFKPKIKHLVFATTSFSDAPLLEKIRKIKSSDYGGLALSVKSWDEIDNDLRLFPEVMRAFYTDSDFKIEWKRDKDDFSTFFADATVEHIDQKVFDLMKTDMAKMHIGDPLRDELKNAASEIALNAAFHSGAKHCRFKILKHEFQIISDGTFFDIGKHLDDPKSIRRGGMNEVEALLKKYEDDLKLQSEEIKSENVHRFIFKRELSEVILHGFSYDIPIEGLFFRSRVESSIKIPHGVSNLVLNLDKNAVPLSNLVMLLRSVLEQMSDSMVLTVKLHRGDGFISYIEKMCYEALRTGRMKIIYSS